MLRQLVAVPPLGPLRGPSERSDLVAGSAVMRQLLMQAQLAAGRVDSPVLITGPVGAGKSHLAQYIHANSSRSSGPLQFVECGALADLDNLLFGHRPGSFTGASSGHKGRLMAAHKGTLVLDDFERLSHRHQDLLHRVVVDGAFYPLGSDQPIQVDVRFIVTTNKDVRAEVAAGVLKEDFVSRLDYFELRVPSLAERPEDVPDLARGLLARNLEMLERKDLRPPGPTSFDPDCWPAIQARRFHDNIRGLDKLIVRLLAHVYEDRPITPRDIEEVSPALPPTRIPYYEQPRTLRMVREEAEREYILRVVNHSGYNLRQAARVLAVSPKCLYAKLRQYGIARD